MSTTCNNIVNSGVLHEKPTMQMEEYMLEVQIIDGTLVPSIDAVREFVKQFTAQLKSDPKLAGAFRLYPREVLASRGISHDLQTELLSEMGVVTAAMGCACTGCCVTSINL